MARPALFAIVLCLAAGCAAGQVGPVPAEAGEGAFPGAPPGAAAPFVARIERVLQALLAADEALADEELELADERALAVTSTLEDAEAALPRSADAGFAPVRELLAGAREQIGQRDPAEARFLLAEAASAVKRVGIAAPLQAARSNLLAGAVALEQEQWELAQSLVAEAIGLIASVRAPEGSLLETEVVSLELEARLFLARFGAGGQPHPDRLRRLASQVDEVPIG